MMNMVLLRPAPLVLLALGVFYLWVYLRRGCLGVDTATAGKHRRNAGDDRIRMIAPMLVKNWISAGNATLSTWRRYE